MSQGMRSPADPLDGLTILIVADDSDALRRIVEPLRSAGAVVVTVRTTAVALAYSDRHGVDIILVDLREPRWWLTPEIRALRALTRAPIYVMTEPGQETPAAALEVAGYFPKPVSVKTLVSTLSPLPRRRR